MHYVLVLMGVALVAILVAVVFVAIGRGGEMARFPNDYAPPEFGALAATDVALLRPPTALWGYHMQATDEALNNIALAISERDVRIASLERQLADLRASAGLPADARPAGPDPQAGGRPPAAADFSAGRAAAAGPAAGLGPATAARHARPTEPGQVDGGAGAESTGRGSTAEAGDPAPAGNSRAPDDPRTGGGASPHESGTSGGSGRSGTGWPGYPDVLAPAADTGAGGSANDSAAAWPGWLGWPGDQAQPPGPQQETPPASHPRSAPSPRQQPDEEETW